MEKENSKICEYTDRIKQVGRKLIQSADSIALEASLMNDSEFAEQMYLQKKAEQAYIHSLSAAIAAQNLIVETAGNSKATIITSDANAASSGIKIDMEFDVYHQIFSCKIMTPPILKSHVASSKFYQLFCMDIEREIINTKPKEFKQIPHAHVIFICHFDANKPPQKQVYFDNDNLAMKGLLDAIIPNICFDDAARFCNNLYLSQPDDSDFCEIFIVPKGKLFHWISSKNSLEFAQEFSQEGP